MVLDQVGCVGIAEGRIELFQFLAMDSVGLVPDNYLARADNIWSGTR